MVVFFPLLQSHLTPSAINLLDILSDCMVIKVKGMRVLIQYHISQDLAAI